MTHLHALLGFRTARDNIHIMYNYLFKGNSTHWQVPVMFKENAEVRVRLKLHQDWQR